MKTLAHIILLFCVLLSSAALEAQVSVKIDREEFKSGDTGFEQAWKAVKEGDAYFTKGLGFYVAARNKYLQAAAYNPYNPELNYKLGICYLFTDHKQKALSLLLNALEGDQNIAPDIHYFLGRAYQYNYQFEKAIEEFKMFRDQADKKMMKKFGTAVDLRLAECQNALEIIQDTVRVEIVNMGPVVNSEYDDYKAVVSPTERHMFYTSRKPSGKKPLPNIADYKFNEDIYQSFVGENGWGVGQLMKPPLNSKFNDAALAFSPDGQEMYLYRGNKKNGNILVSENINGVWSKPKNASSKINSRAQETSIYFTADSSALYFVSDHKKHTTGGKDIFVMYPDESGKWTDPVQVDSLINTPLDEESPFLTPDGRTLYFSSKGHNSMGGFDVFKSEKDSSGHWSKPVNLGFPINTPDDDLFFILTQDSLEGFISGVREVSEGLKDLYTVRFIPPEPADTLVDTIPVMDTVRVVVTDTIQVVDTVEVAPPPPPEPEIKPLKVQGTVTDEEDQSPIMARIEIIDLDENNIAQTTISQRDSGKFNVLLKERKGYGVEINAPGYMFLLDMIPGPESEEDTLIIKNFSMKKMKVGASVVLQNIFFEFNSSTLTPESYPELTRVIKFMDSNPTIRVEIDGHTDNVGSAEYNLKLSEERAKSVARYLIKQGIDPSRIMYKGFGFSQPVATNETEEGRAQNRRVEFKIIGM